jgi:predicted nuclease of predicted toxin-antitoxin system
MDHNIQSAITQGLRRLGIDVITAQEDGAAQRDDELILARATEMGRLVFTHDDDFLAIAGRWLREGREFAGLAPSPRRKACPSAR